MHEPRVLIVDEPTAGLDPEERIRFRNLLCETAQERIVILSTHIVGDIEAACENLAVLNEGEILWKGTLQEILLHAEGKVWRADVDNKELARIKKKYIRPECYNREVISPFVFFPIRYRRWRGYLAMRQTAKTPICTAFSKTDVKSWEVGKRVHKRM